MKSPSPNGDPPYRDNVVAEKDKPGLYLQLQDYWIDANVTQDEWERLILESCKFREYWLQNLIKEIGIESVTWIFETVLSDLEIAKMKLKIKEKECQSI